MTTLWVILTILLALGAGLGAALWSLVRRSSGALLPSAEELLAVPAAAADVYRPMTRLFAAEDFRFLASCADALPGAAARLRRNRSRVLRLYLRQMRRDFDQIYALGRWLAPQSADPGFAGAVTWQAAGFYALWTLAEVRCALGWLAPIRVEVGPLVEALDRLREATRLAVASLQTPDRAAAAS